MSSSAAEALVALWCLLGDDIPPIETQRMSKESSVCIVHVWYA
jgi:hypothetical protein